MGSSASPGSHTVTNMARRPGNRSAAYRTAALATSEPSYAITTDASPPAIGGEPTAAPVVSCLDLTPKRVLCFSMR